MEKLICGLKEKQIRKAYFKKDLEELCNKIQSDKKHSDKEIKELADFLEVLRNEDEDFVKSVAKTFNGKILKDGNPRPPTTDKLYDSQQGKTEEEFTEWKNNVTNAKSTITKIKKEYSSAYKNTAVTKDDWSNWALQIETEKRWLAEYVVYQEQKFNKEICDIIDTTGVSRAQAENRAKVTAHYSNYKNAKREYENLTEIVLLCKKRASVEM